MSIVWTTTLAFVACLLAFLVWVLTDRWRRHASMWPPGLPAIPVFGSLPFLRTSGKSRHLYFMDLSRKYGKIFSYSLGNKLTVVLNDYDVIREALINQAAVFAGRAAPDMPLRRITNPLMKGILEPTFTPSWREDRKVSLTILRDFGFGKSTMQRRILGECDELINYLTTLKAKPSTPKRLFTTAVANVICAITFGTRFQFAECDQLMAAISDIETTFEMFTRLNIFQHLPLLFVVKQLPFFRTRQATMLESHNRVLGFLKTQLRISEQVSQDEDDDDNFCQAYKRTVKDDYDENSLLFLARDLFLAGTETTSLTIIWVLIYMVNYPHIQERVQEELQQAVGSGRQVTLEHKSRTPYTEAVLQEAQRYTVLAPLASPHMVMQDTELYGYHLPRNTTVLINLWSVLRDPRIWPDPDKFRPERFLDDEGSIIHRPELIPFSLGKRMCLGEMMARQEVYLFISNILLNFNVRGPPGVETLSEEDVTFVSRHPLPCQFVFEPRL